MNKVIVLAAGLLVVGLTAHAFDVGNLLPVERKSNKHFQQLTREYEVWRAESPQVLNYQSDLEKKEKTKKGLIENKRPESEWFTREETQALTKLTANRYDIIVVPVQVDGYGFDATTRSLMSLSIAQRISSGTSLRVADPVLVTKALGSTARTYEQEKLEALADKLDVSRLVVSYIEGESKPLINRGKYSFRSSLFTKDNSGKLNESDKRQFSESGIDYANTQIPYETFLTRRDLIVQSILGSDYTLQPQPMHLAKRPDLTFGEKLTDIFSLDNQNPLKPIHNLQLLGSLQAQSTSLRSRHLLFERSLVLLEYIDPESDDYDLLRGRALAHLDRRVTAMDSLAETEGNIPASHLKLLIEYLNGNINKQAYALPDDTSEILDVIGMLENTRLRFYYNLPPTWDGLSTIGSILSEPWQYIVGEAAMDQFVWQDHSNVSLKYLLDISFPNQELSVEASALQINLNPDLDSERLITEVLLKHLDRIESMDTNHTGLAPGVADITEFVRNSAVENTLQRIRKNNYTLGRPKEAMDIADIMADLFSGHPDMSILLGSLKQNAQMKIDGVLLAGQRTVPNVQIANQFNFLDKKYRLLTNDQVDKITYKHDWPSFSGYYTNCLYSTISAHSCLVDAVEKALKAGNVTHAAEIMHSNSHRFHGHPKLLDFRFRAFQALGDKEGLNQLQQLIENNETSEWSLYERIALYYLEQNKPEDALSIITAYPGLHEAGHMTTLGLVGNLYSIGSQFWWSGAYEQAQVLYKLVDGHSTGSASEMASRQRLALLDRDYEAAITQSKNRVRRYRDKYGLRDLIGLLVKTNNIPMAKNVMKTARASLIEPEIWTAALILHRANAYSAEDISNWLDGVDLKSKKGKPHSHIGRYLFLSHMVDRKIPEELAQWIRDRHPDELQSTLQARFQRNAYKNLEYPREDSIAPSMDILPAMASEALFALEQGDYEKVYDILDMATYGHAIDEFLPYYALAAIKTGKTTRLENYLNQYQYGNYNGSIVQESNYPATDQADFDARLAQAVLHAGNGNHEEAISFLQLANNDVLHTTNRLIFTRYQIIETARLLFDHSADERYRKFALDLARRNEVIEPIQTYSLSFVAMLSSNETERVNALAELLRLDPGSRSIESAKPEELEKARHLIHKPDSYTIISRNPGI